MEPEIAQLYNQRATSPGLSGMLHKAVIMELTALCPSSGDHRPWMGDTAEKAALSLLTVLWSFPPIPASKKVSPYVPLGASFAPPPARLLSSHPYFPRYQQTSQPSQPSMMILQHPVCLFSLDRPSNVTHLTGAGQSPQQHHKSFDACETFGDLPKFCFHQRDTLSWL